MGDESNKQGRPPIHDERMEHVQTRLPARIVRWLLGRNPDNVSAAVRQQLIDDYNSSKNETTDD